MSANFFKNSVGYGATVDGFVSSTSVWLQPSKETFARGDLIQVLGADIEANNAVYEVADYRYKPPDCWTLEISSEPSEAFCESAFVQDFSDHKAKVIKINVSVLRIGGARLKKAKDSSASSPGEYVSLRVRMRSILRWISIVGALCALGLVIPVIWELPFVLWAPRLVLYAVLFSAGICAFHLFRDRSHP